MAAFELPRVIFEDTFALFRQCGRGRHECQALWLSPWSASGLITEVVHPVHRAGSHGFALDDRWLNDFWLRLHRDGLGVRLQVHTHPHEAFHSLVDDKYPIVHSVGFFSLVIPDFGLGPVGFDNAYLTQIQEDGRWKQVPIKANLILV